jgi:type 1 fimbria pilin
MNTASPVRVVVAALVAAAVVFVPMFQTGLSASSTAATSITDITIHSDGRIHIVQGDGQEIAPPREKDQVSVDSAAVASDNLTAGSLNTATAARPIQFR